VVLPEEWHFHSAPYVYQWLPCSPAFLGRGSGQEGPRQVASLAQEPSAIPARWIDRDAPPAYIFQLPDPTAPEAEDQDVDISWSKLPNRPSSEELSAVEVEARIHKVLALGVIPTTGAGPIPLRRGIASVRISTLDPIFVAFMILSFHYACDLVQGLGGGCGEP
jgi:hypothetical protein